MRVRAREGESEREGDGDFETNGWREPEAFHSCVCPIMGTRWKPPNIHAHKVRSKLKLGVFHGSILRSLSAILAASQTRTPSCS